jgi:pimeloyl-ACP methyl ester carboxylesterase
MTDHFFTLPDDRTLAYAVYGRGDGFPVFYFNGTPSSRLELLMLPAFGVNIEDNLQKLNLRMIAVDRPGFGLSTFNPKGNFRSFADDVAQLAASLNIRVAKSVAWSGGGPYALTQAFYYPELVQEVFILTGFTINFSEPGVFSKMTANRLYFGAARSMPWLLKPALRFVARKPAQKPLPRWLSRVPNPDFKMFAGDKLKAELFSRYTTVEAVRQNANGAVHEANLYFNSIDYVLGDIKQTVHYWWGTDDNVVLPDHYTALQQRAPNQHVYIKEGEGHFSIYVNCMEEVLQKVTKSLQ